MPLIALDIAILPPDEVARRATELSASLPRGESQGLLLGPDYLPHITLVQLFADTSETSTLLTHVEDIVRDRSPLNLRVSGGGRTGASSVWMEIESAPALIDLHQRLLEATQPFECAGGDASAFFCGDARARDVRWVAQYRETSSGRWFQPHITLGHASHSPVIEPFDFTATRVAACHLGRFCSCRRVLRAFHLRSPC
jgi:2'-5' RNA ligase